MMWGHERATSMGIEKSFLSLFTFCNINVTDEPTSKDRMMPQISKLVPKRVP